MVIVSGNILMTSESTASAWPGPTACKAGNDVRAKANEAQNRDVPRCPSLTDRRISGRDGCQSVSGECGSARLALETTWAVLLRRAARGSTYRKATCGAAFRLRLSVTPFKVADPRISPL